jgi:V/A-type H+-transporting ATPase subunit E
MALQDLLTVLEEDAAAEHELAQAERRRVAAHVIADARARAVDLCAEAVEAAESVARQEAHGIETQARAAARLAVRDARDTALAAVLAQARERLQELPGTHAGAAMTRACLAEALAALPRPTRVRVHPDDAAAVPPEVAPMLVPNLQCGGAIAEDDEGRYVDNTYATRLASAWPELRAELSNSWAQAS